MTDDKDWYEVVLSFPVHVYDGYGPSPPDSNSLLVKAEPADEDEIRKKVSEKCPCDFEILDISYATWLNDE